MRDVSMLPKAHLHVHLESAIRWPTLRELAAANGAAAPVRPAGGFSGFRQFADYGALVRGCLWRWDDFRRVAVEFCEDEAAQGTRYAEVTFTAASHGERVDLPEMPLRAVLDGLDEGRDAYGVDCRVILDHSRRRSVERAWRTVELAVRFDRGVVGLGVAGDESYPLTPFVDVFEAAAEAGLRIVHHAGEAAGAASIREAVGPGRAERIGHGIRVLDDPGLVAEMRDRAIPLEVCPSSNVALGLVPGLADHPLPRLVEQGLLVTLNSDIPAIAGTSLSQEYARVRDAFGYEDAALADLARAGVDASFAPPDAKADLRCGITDWLERRSA